jgi:RNA polymerase sigma-70 factor (ECF subfamily)
MGLLDRLTIRKDNGEGMDLSPGPGADPLEAACTSPVTPIEWEQLFRQNGQKLFLFIQGYLRNRASSEEILQDVFVRAIRNEDRFRRESSPKTWLFSIARNLCLDELRKYKHRNHESLDKTQPLGNSPLVENLSHGGELPDQEAGHSQFTEELRKALEQMPPEQAEVFILREIQHHPFQEIAALTGTPVNTVKSRMRYAMKYLREALVSHSPREES